MFVSRDVVTVVALCALTTACDSVTPGVVPEPTAERPERAAADPRRVRSEHDASIADASATPRPSESDAGAEPTDASGSTPDVPALDAAVPESPWVLVNDVVNARDLGGTVVGDGIVVGHAVYRGPTLARLTPQGCEAFTGTGIRTVVDLRVPSERASTPESECVTDQVRLVLAPLPVPYSVSPADYVAIVKSSESIAAVFHVLASAESYPVYLHCTYGRDRTGVFVALVLRALGATREEILREYLLSQPLVGAYPASLEAALDMVEDAGGIENYLTTIGVTGAELSALRHRVVAPQPSR